MIPIAKPILKWAGGKGQMLQALHRHLPNKFERYVEPMIGGGALFFALSPHSALIADSNPELINFYRAVAEHGDKVLITYSSWPFSERMFYELRALQFADLDSITAAARLLYLNRSCFNGLYRVNRQGAFNVPWGRYSQPYKPDIEQFGAARAALVKARIELGEFQDVLSSEARSGDLIFLDPPYVPISTYSDFKRYTLRQFSEDDHRAMASLVSELSDRGCELIITNSNHPLVHDLYQGYKREIVPTRRNVNSRAEGRTGEDLIIHVPAR